MGEELFVTKYDGKIMEGQDGWYFLSNDTNHIVDQLRGRLPFSVRELRGWRHRLEARSAWLAERGAPYLFVVAPNPHSMYPEKLPAGVVQSEERPVIQLIEELSRVGSPARFVYPLDQILAARERRPVASPNDTHWNSFGAFVAYSSLLDEIEDEVEVRRVTEEELEFFEANRTGDLGAKLTPPLFLPQLTARVRGRSARVVSDNRVQNRGRLVEFESTAAPETTCVVMGDSFTYKVLPFLAETFGRTVFAQLHTFDYDLVETYSPQLVVGLVNERFLRRTWREFDSPSTLELAEQKERDGLVGATPIAVLFEDPVAI